MNPAQTAKFAPILAPISVAGGATATSLVVDTLGFSHGAFYAFFGLIGANGITACKFQEADTSGGSYTDISGADIGALTDSDDGECHGGTIKFGAGRKRYIKIVLTNGATNASLCSAFALLYGANEVPNSATERGLSSQFTVS